jgi:type II secretory ATPase GspE/PulE/Tfp pilus assembly ATPase PilB-like protein
MPVSDEIRDLALHSASADRIMETARAEGMRTLREDAFEKVKHGVTAIDEVLRVLGA